MVRRQSATAQPVNTEDLSDEDIPEVDPSARRDQLARQAQAQLPTLTARVMSTSELHDIQSFEDAVALYQQVTGQEVVEAREEIGDGFDYLDNKDYLVGRPSLILKWEPALSESFTDRDGKPLKTVQVWVITQGIKGTLKFRISDFSTGLCEQLWEYSLRTGRNGGLMAPKGLRKSEFPYVNKETGERTVAKTYYLDLTKDL